MLAEKPERITRLFEKVANWKPPKHWLIRLEQVSLDKGFAVVRLIVDGLPALVSVDGKYIQVYSVYSHFPVTEVHIQPVSAQNSNSGGHNRNINISYVFSLHVHHL